MARESKIIIAKNIKIDKEYKEVLNYTESQMLSLVETNAVASALDYSFIRDKGTISTNFTYNQALQCNYMAFQNKDYSNKWFFAWIEDVRYVNDGTTEISYTVDSWSTWFEKLNVGQSFVLREHTNSDNYHEYRLPEDINVANYVIKDIAKLSTFSDCHVVMATTVSPYDGSNVAFGKYGGIISASKYYIFENDTALQNGLLTIANAGKSSNITGIFIAPDVLTGYDDATFTNGIAEVPESTYSTFTSSLTIDLHPTTIDGYTPKNKKVFNSPYYTYILSNNSGEAVEYKIEDFLDNQEHLGSISIVGTLTPGCSIRAIPVDYQCDEYSQVVMDNNEYGINLGKFPICSFPVDMYTNWLTQNAVNNVTGTITSTIELVSGLMNTNSSSAISGAKGIADLLGKYHQASLMGYQTNGNTNSGDVTFANGDLTFTGYVKCAKREEIISIDNYFTRYGYKINQLKVPNITGRAYWNYIKIAPEDNLGSGEIPQKFMDEINRIARQGTTIWHSHNNIGNYSLDNSIVTP